ncbi:MAG: cell wall hydrolase [Lachnospiraceae bacterium]|nr:cell wall hydrolase [Lachnospiraceae bacterium]
MKKRLFRQSGRLLLFCGLLLLFAQDVSATSTADKLNRVQKQKESNENKLGETEETIDSLKVEQQGLQGYLEQISARLEESTQKLREIEEQISQKERDIEEMQMDLEEAQRAEEEQYEAMRQRIRFMYERSQNLYLDLFFSSESFAGFLNQTQYIEKMTEYDREMLQNYQKLQEKIVQEREFLKQEVEGLEELRSEAEDNNDDISKLVEKAHAGVEEYANEISQKEQEALALEEQIRRQELQTEDLERQLAAEIALSRLAASSQSRDLSGIAFSATDLDMLAAIIECEAGGEPYTGKVAVGAVVLNRVRSSLFPDTVAGVIYQNRQFSPVGSGRFAMVLARGANASCYEAAQEAMNGSTPVGNCVFFRTPIPGLTGIQIGGHIFY